MAKRKCLYCQGEFDAKPSSKYKYCSSECYVAHRRSKNMHQCQQCGSEFYRPAGHARRAKAGLFCSRKCFTEWNQGQNNPAFVGGKIECKCAKCGKLFAVKPYYLKRPRKTSLFCSIKCRSESLSGENSPGYITDRVTVVCEVCGKVRHLAPSHAKGDRFCSRQCQGKAKRVENAGQRNGRYVHGQANFPYPTGFTDCLKKEIRDRHEGKCALCGIDETANGLRVMDVHHIDYDKENLEQWNLIPLCRMCHGKMHGSQKRRAECRARLSKLLEDYKKNRM